MTHQTLEDLRLAIAEFANERDWGQFHTPKNLASALSVEAAELLEIFQWLESSESELSQLSPAQVQAIRNEMGDVMNRPGFCRGSVY